MKKITLFLVAMTMSLFSFAQSQMSGTYTVGTGGTYDYASMADAGMAIKSAEFTGDVTLLICTDLTETINTGIVNKSNYTLTIRPDKDENRTITYTTAKDNTGPTGVFVIGGNMTKTPGTTIGWASIPTRNVIVDGAAAGYTTPRLKITNEVFGTNVLLYGDVQDVIIRNCILVGRSSSTAYALVFRSENYSQTSKDIAPQNCLVENCILQSSSPSSQTVYFQGNQANSVAGWPASITIRNTTIKARTRGIYVRQVKNLNIEGCTFDMSNSSGGILAHAIMGEGTRGTINVKGNKFIKNSTANYHGGTYGLQTITASGGADVWVIENNYFAGYDALKAISNTTGGTEARLVAVRCGDYCEVRHNTFHMPKLTKDQASKLVSASPTTLLWLAGSHQYPVQNNIFVCEETTANVSLIRGGLNENVTGNVFYHKGGNAAIVAASPSCTTFVDLETSYPAQAATSKWTNVTFTDVANGDLSLDGSSDGDANLAVDRLAEVLTDINGKARREKTYAGAYEGGEFPAEVCKVDVTVTPVGSGIVEGAGECAKGSDVTLTPKPNTGYEFTGWTFEDETTSTANPLIITVDGDKDITANFAKKQYTLTVLANDAAKGDVTGNGTYEYGTEVEITATAKTGYEFTGWSNGSKENPLTITMEENTELTANFRAVLASSITLNAHPVRDYSTSIVGTMKRAIQNGENTIVLTHEANGTAHIYNIAHATKTITEISQEGVVAVDPDNAGDFLAISDIAVTEDGKLVACNYMMCQITDNEVDAGYKRGTSRFYIWDNLASNPRVWFTSQLTGNYYRASMGYTMALKGTSLNAEVTISAFNKSNSNTRYSHLYVVDGTYSDANYKYSRDNAALHPNTLGKNTYELNASPLAAGKWIVDGELASPIEFVEKDAVAIDTYTALNTNVLGKKYNGASYLFHKDHHLMIAPYAADDKLAGVKVLGITDGFGSAVEVTTSTNLVSAVNAVAAAATAYVDGDGDLTIYLIADGKVYTFSEKVYTAQTFTVTATAGEGGSVEGGGTYEEGATAKLTATANKHYDFVNWTGDVTSTENPLMITVNSALTVTANFQEHDKFTINAHADHTSKGYVTGGGTDIYVGTELVLKATAKTGYYFTQWQDGNTDNPRTISVTEAAEYIAEFAEAYPRVYAYNLNVVSNGDDTYTFSFKPNTDATSGNLILYNEDGTTVAKTVAITMPIVANTVNSITLLKTELPDQPVIPWAIELIGNAIPAFAEIFADTDYRFARAHAVIDNSPESEYFGRVYVADRRQTKQNSKVYVYNPDFTDLTATNLGLATAGYSRPAVGADGTLYLTGYTDGAEAGIFVVDPADLTKCTQFFNGTYDSDGLYKNNGKEIGSSTSGVGVYGEGKDAVLYTMMEDGSNANFDRGKQPIVCYQIGQENGTVLKQWSDEPTWLVNYPATGYDTYNYGNNDFSATAKGVWVSQNKSNPADRPEIAFVDKTGTIQFMQNSKPSLGGGMTVNADNTALYIVEDSKILEYAITWNENTPSLTLSNTYPISLQYISTLSVDYAGNLIACAGTTYKTTDNNVMKLVAFTLPTDNNTCIVPAAKAKALKLGTIYNIEVAVNDPAMGSATGGGEYVEGETATLEASPAAHHKFVNWTYGSETSTNNPLELVVEENITVTANFEPVQYTLITPTNDENKGTVAGAGTYAHGTVATLTATPKEGYKLLYWSDRSTENPRTITMTKNEAVSAYFVKEYAEEPTFKIEKMWENTQVPGSADGYQAVGWYGKIYMQNKTAGKIKVYSNGTDAAVDYATSNTSGQQIAVDEAGNLIVFNAYFATATPSAIQIYKKGSTTGTAISFTLPYPERCDFISASGDIYSAEGGYVYFYCQNKNAVNRVKITNGALASVDAIGNTANPATSVSHVMVDIFGNLAAHCRSTAVYAINSYTGETTAFNASLSGIKLSTLGGCSFELGGKELWAYNVGTTHYNSEWNLYNMTDKVFMSNETLYAKDKVSKKELGSSNWLNVQVVDENTAYIYQFCPEVAVAVWKVSIETEVNVTIDENADNKTILTPHEGEVVNATVNRNFGANKILTVTLPFDMDATQISTFFGMATIYEFYNVVDAGEELHLQFSRTTSIEAGKPYIIQTAASGYDAEDGFTIEGVTVTTDLTPIELNGITMVPVLDGGGRLENANEYFLSNSALYCAGDYPRDLQGLRAYFTSNSSKTLRARVVFDDNEETSLPTITNPNNNVQKIVKNGQLIIIRGENQYNAQGQTISIE